MSDSGEKDKVKREEAEDTGERLDVDGESQGGSASSKLGYLSVCGTSGLMPSCLKSSLGVPLWLSGLKNGCCHYSTSGYSCGTGLIPGLGTSSYFGCSQK